MDALRFYGVRDVRFEQIPVPQPAKDEVLVRVLYAGICGSDLHIYRKSMFVQNIPETMGHEFVGRVEACGAQVTGFRGGELVVGNPMFPCMHCESCRSGSYNTCRSLGFIGEVSQGCFAQTIAVREKDLLLAPAGASAHDLVLSEPLAVAIHICKRAALTPESRIAVIWAGPIGLLTASAAKNLFGVKDITVVELAQARLAYAQKAGAAHTLQNIGEAPENFEKIIETAGVQVTINQALQKLTPQGTLYIVSVFEDDTCINLNDLVGNEGKIVGCNVYTREDLADAVAAIGTGKIDIGFLISHEFALKDGKDAFELLVSKDKTAEKVIFAIGGN